MNQNLAKCLKQSYGEKFFASDNKESIKLYTLACRFLKNFPTVRSNSTVYYTLSILNVIFLFEQNLHTLVRTTTNNMSCITTSACI